MGKHQTRHVAIWLPGWIIVRPFSTSLMALGMGPGTQASVPLCREDEFHTDFCATFL